MRPLYQPDRTLVDVCYRKRVRDFNEWEIAERNRQEEAVRAFIARERRPARVPKWIAVIGSIVVVSVVAWIFVTLAYSLRG